MRHDEWSRWLFAAALVTAVFGYFGIAPSFAAEPEEKAEGEVEMEAEFQVNDREAEEREEMERREAEEREAIERREAEEREEMERREAEEREEMEQREEEREREEGVEEREVSMEVLLDFLAEQFPDWRKEIGELRERAERGDRRAAREVDQMFEGIREMYFLSKENPDEFAVAKKLHNLEGESHALGMKFREIKEEDARREIGERLKKVLNEIFEIRQERRQREAEAIARELEHIRKMLKLRQENRERIIDRRFQELTGMAEALEW